MPFQVLQPPFSINNPFTIAKWTGQANNDKNSPLFYVTRGTVLSTFSLDTGTFINIKGMENSYPFCPNCKFYIEFTVLPNLQITGAELKCTRVGSPDPNSVKDLYPSNWPSYPNLLHIEPKDVYDSNGKIQILKNGKRQGKCYALIGYRSDDSEQNGQSYDPNQPGGQTQVDAGGLDFFPIQVLQSDIIMVNVASNGTPCVVPMPYFNTTNHYNAIVSP
jgi:hypothetical protein